MRNWLKNLPISSKINVAILTALAMIAILILALEILSTNQLADEINSLRLEDEIAILIANFQDQEGDLSRDLAIIAATPNLVTAVEAQNREAIRTLFLSSITSIQIDSFEIVTQNNLTLLSDQPSRSQRRSELLAQSTLGVTRTSLLIEQGDTQAEPTKVSIAAIRPLRNASGVVVGGVLITKKVDHAFLTKLNNERTNVGVTLIQDEKIIAHSFIPITDGREDPNLLPINPTNATMAQSGMSVISTDEEYSESGTAYTTAYVPLQGLNNLEPLAVLLIQINSDGIRTFQNNLVLNSIILLSIAVVCISIGTIALIRRFVTGPIQQLQVATASITDGDYEQAISIDSQDEIGQLANSFNYMRKQQQVAFLQITEAKTQAEQANELKSQFISRMSHELRTPLNGVINMVDFVRQGMWGPVQDKQDEALSTASSSARDLLDFINDILDFSKIESGMMNLSKEPVELTRLVDRILITTKGLLTEKIEFHVDIPEDLSNIDADPRRLRQILINLLGNAIKYTEEGSVSIKAVEHENFIHIQIIDTGIGIPAQDYNKIFRSFVQAGNRRSDALSSGLGLAITKELIDLHNGRIWFESEVNKGTTFHLLLPRHFPIQ